jgi:hypothetical protein
MASEVLSKTPDRGVGVVGRHELCNLPLIKKFIVSLRIPI